MRGIGESKLSIYRHLAPLTVNALLRALPLNTRANLQPAMVCMLTDLRVGVEKPRASFVKGDVAFLPSAGLICVFLGAATSDRPLNPLGKVDDGIQTFERMRPGDVLRLALNESGIKPAGTVLPVS
ncbi:MAG: hypothetical protein HY297_03330 [Thaumarchaeota archaeon]|nr:hypothetical protein [Nitrososphaerota archaeon]